MRVYTIHVPRQPLGALGSALEASIAKARAVKDGFCWPAFFFSFLWALWHRLWFIAAAIFGAEFATGFAVEAAGFDVVTQTATSLGVALIVGWIANDVVRREYQRRGLSEAGVVLADSAEDAIRRYFTETAQASRSIDGSRP